VLEDAEAVDGKAGPLVVAGIANGIRASTLAAHHVVDASCPIAAQPKEGQARGGENERGDSRDVEDNHLLLVDELTRTAVLAPECLGLGPGLGVWDSTIGEIGRDLIATESPDANAGVVHEGDKDTTAPDVELMTVRQRIGVANATACVAILESIAVGSMDLAGKLGTSIWGCIEVAAIRCVQGHSVRVPVVHPLED
jgi:hypothetical protein